MAMVERQTWGPGKQPLDHAARNPAQARQVAALRELNTLTLMRTFMDDPRLWQRHTPQRDAG
jgi:hypothetical protein